MWVYFDVPETRYLDDMAERSEDRSAPDFRLILADKTTFPHHGKLGAIGAGFKTETGAIAFRADFPNPHSLLRHG